MRRVSDDLLLGVVGIDVQVVEEGALQMRLVELGYGHVFVHLLEGCWVVQGLHDTCLAGRLIAFAIALPDHLSRTIAHCLLSYLHVAGRLDKLALVAALFGWARIAVKDVRFQRLLGQSARVLECQVLIGRTALYTLEEFAHGAHVTL